MDEFFLTGMYSAPSESSPERCGPTRTWPPTEKAGSQCAAVKTTRGATRVPVQCDFLRYPAWFTRPIALKGALAASRILRERMSSQADEPACERWQITRSAPSALKWRATFPTPASWPLAWMAKDKANAVTPTCISLCITHPIIPDRTPSKILLFATARDGPGDLLCSQVIDECCAHFS